MKTVGNTASNKIYNPRGVNPNVPIDVDEVDSAMERFIRQKYESRSLADGKPRPPSRNETGYTNKPTVVEQSPPLPPPKQGKWFGFGLRSSSSAYPFSKADRNAMDAADIRAASPPVASNKQSKVFGMGVGDTATETTEYKLVALREMGFPDDARNSKVLNSLNGNLERTIESLTRLGEGSQPPSRSRTPGGTTPTSATFPRHIASPSNGSNKSSNPFDKRSPSSAGTQSFGLSLDLPQKQPSEPTQQTTTRSYNPFDIPAQNQQPNPQALGQALQGLQIAQTQSQLFPHNTGGYPMQQPQQSQNPYGQPFAPSAAMGGPMLTVSPPPVEGNYNPFFQPQQQQQQQPQNNVHNPYATNQFQPQSNTNPFLGQTNSSPFGVQAQPQVAYQQQPQQSFNSSIFGTSPSQSQLQYQQQFQQQQHQQPQQQQQQQQNPSAGGSE